ncbi:unnamed protein product [Phytophthora fragariaefolia]|uniref:Unnamed protein product n=1 Tax=Phytophthora fragariaefolia TaxID=1490495 RepID=A0A9W6UBQ4_9STRA|nr:unnamed protein product [Phytophthora fragariaefolia]
MRTMYSSAHASSDSLSPLFLDAGDAEMARAAQDVRDAYGPIIAAAGRCAQPGSNTDEVQPSSSRTPPVLDGSERSPEHDARCSQDRHEVQPRCCGARSTRGFWPRRSKAGNETCRCGSLLYVGGFGDPAAVDGVLLGMDYSDEPPQLL